MNRWQGVVGWLLGGACLYYFVFHFFEWETARSVIRDIDPVRGAAALIAFGAAMAARAVKWTYIIRTRARTRWLDGFHTIMISNMVNFLFPVRIGEALKVFMINRVARIPLSLGLSATLTDRISQLFVISLVLTTTVWAGFRFETWGIVFSTFLGVFWCALALFYFFGPYILSCVDRAVSTWWPAGQANSEAPSKPARVIGFLRDTLCQMNLEAFSGRQILVVIGQAVAIIILDGLSFYWLLAAFGAPISWFQGCVAACLLCLTFILPTPPGQIGTAEMYPVLIFSWGLGKPEAVISTMAVFWHVMSTAMVVLMGFMSLMALNLTFRTLWIRANRPQADL